MPQPSMASPLLSLPLEILLEITGRLAEGDLQGVHALSLVSKRCCSLANRHRFRNVHFTILGEKRMQVHIERWEQILARNEAFAFVRRLSVHLAINGTGPSSEYDHMDDPEEREPDEYRHAFIDEGEWSCLITIYFLLFFSPSRIGKNPPQERDTWRPLASFLRRLSGLEDFVWITGVEVPVCLLNVLHQDIPACRLHLRAFSGFKSLTADGQLNEYEHTLATSRSLSSVVCEVDQGVNSLQEQAIMQMAAGASPSLEQLYIRYSPPDFTSPYWLTHGARPTLPKCFHNQPSRTLSSLRVLGMAGSSPDGTAMDELEGWSKIIPFHNLQSLQLHTFQNERLLVNAPLYRFSSLKTLALDLGINKMNIEDRQGTVYRVDSAASGFLYSLPPLESLYLSSTYSEKSFNAAIQRHGPRLKRFGLVPQLSQDSWRWRITPEMLQEVSSACPNLSSLTVRIERTQGDSNEINIYKALRLVRLKHLTIELDCAFKSRENPYGTESIRDFLINRAVDEALVRAILAKITEDVGCSTLQSLTVIPRTSGRLPWDLRAFSRLMPKTWKLERPSDRFILTRASYEENYDMPRNLDSLESQFRELWPLKKGDNWTFDWHSLPLA